MSKATIVALATPPGRSGVAVIRLSGVSALQIISRISNRPGSSFQPRFASLTKIYDCELKELIDEAIVTYFKAPASFTGEDVIEISCHGSPILIRRIIDCCLKLDARMAEAGEFSLRALSNGKINLNQAEAIRDLINSQTTSSARQAVRQLRGEFSHQLDPIKQDLLNIIVIFESAVEFVEDDLPDFLKDNIKNQLVDISERLQKIASTFRIGKLLREGLKVALAGRPNVGKSSIFNALVGSERSIVTNIPGTTRDSLYENITIGDFPFLIADTAGLHETNDVVESIGVEKSKRLMADSDLVIIILDGSQELTPEDKTIFSALSDQQKLVLINKSDLSQKISTSDPFITNHKFIRLSAKTGAGFDLLEKSIINFFNLLNIENTGFLVSDSRHFDLLNRADEEISMSILQIDDKLSEEIILIGLYNTLTLLGHITGETSNDDILSQIFSTFCIGK